MEDLLKDALPKEVIEVQDAIQQVVEPEPSGLTWYQGIGTVSYTHLTLPTTPYV